MPAGEIGHGIEPYRQILRRGRWPTVTAGLNKADPQRQIGAANQMDTNTMLPVNTPKIVTGRPW